MMEKQAGDTGNFTVNHKASKQLCNLAVFSHSNYTLFSETVALELNCNGVYEVADIGVTVGKL